MSPLLNPVKIATARAAELSLYQRRSEILPPTYQTTAPSNYVAFDKLTSMYFRYYLILLINCDLNIFAHKWFTRLKIILPVLIHLSQRGLIKGLDEHWDRGVIWLFGTGPPDIGPQ